MFEIPFQQPVLVTKHEVFERVEHRVCDGQDLGIVVKQHGKLALEHQHTRRNGSEDGKAVFDVSGKKWRVQVLESFHALQVAKLQLGHAAADFIFNNGVGNLVVIENPQQIQPDPGLVVVDVASRKDRDLA